MKLIIHDLPPKDHISELLTKEDHYILPAKGPKAPCLGCFGCWIKTPANCVLKDRLKDMGAMLANCDELVIISESLYGGFAPDTKNIVDRSISYLLPFFKNINGEMHHVPRYKNSFKFAVYFYNSSEVSNDEHNLLENYINAVSINLNASTTTIHFLDTMEELYGTFTNAVN